MGAFATLKISVDATTIAKRHDTARILGMVPGTESLAFTDDGLFATMRMEMPGNLDVPVARLRKRGLLRAETIDVSFPVKPTVAEKPVDAADVLRRLRQSTSIHNPMFDGQTISATIAASTSPMRFMYEELIQANLRPLDHATVADKDVYVY